MKYALIGCGRIAVNHIKAAVDNHLEIIGVCDIISEHMDNILTLHNLAANSSIYKYTDYNKMLDDLKPDIVGIATESGKHAQIALDCIDRGINVIVEKPIAMSIHDADEIIRRSKSKNVKVAACHQNRFNIAVQETRRALEAGRFGKLSHGSIHVRWNRDKSYYTQAPWRGTWAQDGGCLMNQCIHGIDLLRWMFGNDVEEVYGQTRQQFHTYLEAEDVGLAILKFRNGVIGTIEGTTNVYPQNLEETLYIFGEKGTVKLGGKSCNSIDIWKFSDEDNSDGKRIGFTENTVNVYGNGHTSLYADMIDAVKNNRSPYIDAQAGKNALEIVLAIYKSQKENRPVRLPLSDYASTDMAGECL
jgi:predicted dehydrogenase